VLSVYIGSILLYFWPWCRHWSSWPSTVPPVEIRTSHFLVSRTARSMASAIHYRRTATAALSRATHLSADTTIRTSQEVLDDMLQHGLMKEGQIWPADRCFLSNKPSGAARFITELSPLTPSYKLPSMRLNSAAEVIATIREDEHTIKLDLSPNFFETSIAPQHRQCYVIYYNGIRYRFTRLPMGQPLAPSLMQRTAQTVTHILHRKHHVNMVAHLDDWLIFGRHIPQPHIMPTLTTLGFSISRKSNL
jgi:hypothetical protein